MPSDPDTGPITGGTLSCSTTFLTALRAESGLALVGMMIVSISRDHLAAGLLDRDLETAHPVLAPGRAPTPRRSVSPSTRRSRPTTQTSGGGRFRPSRCTCEEPGRDVGSVDIAID